jgi:molecular chaperone GrpE (heat shock protein)
MRPPRWLPSLFTPFRRASKARARTVHEPADVPHTAPEPEPDVAEEFQKLHRGLRRLSLASDRSGELLQAVSARLDDMQQRLLRMSRPEQAGLALEESDLLRVLDHLDRASGVAGLPDAARELMQGAKSAVLQVAGWQPIAVAGARPEGVGIRIAEFLGEPAANGHGDARIHRILEQGYRRADGTLLRPGVVIAAAANSNAHGALS